jgi:hypothetical protein
MTICLKGHWSGGGRRGNESLIASHLRFQIYAATPLIASIVYLISKILGTRVSASRWQVRPNQAKTQRPGQNQTEIRPIQTKKVAALRAGRNWPVLEANSSLPAKNISSLLPGKKPRIIWQIRKKHPQKRVKKPAIFAQ